MGTELYMTSQEIVFETVPKELAERAQWVVWQIEQSDGKPTKIPYNPNSPNVKAKASVSATWGSLEKAIEVSRRTGFQGIGFEFNGEGYVGIDLDHAADPETGELDAWAKKIVDRFNSYTELSPSGAGVHILCRGKKPSDKCRTSIPKSWNGQPDAHVEVYDAGRYFTVTGRRLEQTPFELKEGTENLQKLFAELWPEPSHSQQLCPSPSVNFSDQELFDKIQRSDQAAKFTKLWAGDSSDFPSASEADLSLCCILAFWTRKDAARIDSLFRQSALMRDKWDKKHGSCTYGESTIQEAINFTKEVYNPGEKS